MIEFCEISKVFNTDLLKKNFQALSNVSFKIPEGKIIGFLGANGAGKTTSIKIAMDFIRPTSGEILYDKSLGGSKKEAFKYIGYLPERPFFYSHLTGRDFCKYLSQLSNVSNRLFEERVNKWAPIFKIEHALDRYIKNYSKGMLQRIGFLATIIHDPKLIILDEPLSGLDPIGRKELKDVIVELNKEGKTIFFSSHIISDVEEICDSVIFLKNGEIVFNGSVDQVISANIKPVTNISYFKENQVKMIKVDNNNKSNEIKRIIEDGGDIISVQADRPTLEQIFYNVK